MTHDLRGRWAFSELRSDQDRSTCPHLLVGLWGRYRYGYSSLAGSRIHVAVYAHLRLVPVSAPDEWILLVSRAYNQVTMRDLPEDYCISVPPMSISGEIFYTAQLVYSRMAKAHVCGGFLRVECARSCGIDDVWLEGAAHPLFKYPSVPLTPLQLAPPQNCAFKAQHPTREVAPRVCEEHGGGEREYRAPGSSPLVYVAAYLPQKRPVIWNFGGAFAPRNEKRTTQPQRLNIPCGRA